MRSSVTRSPPATSRWPTGQDNATAPEQGPFLCDSLIVKERQRPHKPTQPQEQRYCHREDLTYANYQVFRKASEHSATMSVWSSNGKILAKVKNGRIVRVNIHTDLDEDFRRAMSGNEMNADEEE